MAIPRRVLAIGGPVDGQYLDAGERTFLIEVPILNSPEAHRYYIHTIRLGEVEMFFGLGEGEDTGIILRKLCEVYAGRANVATLMPIGPVLAAHEALDQIAFALGQDWAAEAENRKLDPIAYAAFLVDRIRLDFMPRRSDDDDRATAANDMLHSLQESKRLVDEFSEKIKAMGASEDIDARIRFLEGQVSDECSAREAFAANVAKLLGLNPTGSTVGIEDMVLKHLETKGLMRKVAAAESAPTASILARITMLEREVLRLKADIDERTGARRG